MGNSAVAGAIAGGRRSTRAAGGAPTPVQRAPGSPAKVASPGKPRFTEKEYASWSARHPKRTWAYGGSFEPDYLYNRYTPKWFADQGYVYALTLGPFGNLTFEVWIDDAGAGREFRVHRWTDSSPSGAPSSPAPGPEGKPKDGGPSGGGGPAPLTVIPDVDHEKLFGPVVAIKEGADAAFGTGDLIRYRDGTVELYLDGGGTYLFRPVAGGKYIVYGTDGKRLNNKTWSIPAGDIPDPVTDAAD